MMRASGKDVVSRSF